MQRPRGPSPSLLGRLWLLLVLGTTASSLLRCASAQVKKQVADMRWKPATATWYGSPDGDGSDGKLVRPDPWCSYIARIY